MKDETNNEMKIPEGQQIVDVQNGAPDTGAESSESGGNAFSKVAVQPKQKKILIVAVMVAAVAGLYYALFGMAPSEQEIKRKEKAEKAAKQESLLKQAEEPSSNVLDSDKIGKQGDSQLTQPMVLTQPKAPEPPPPPLPQTPATPFGQGSLPGAITNQQDIGYNRSLGQAASIKLPNSSDKKRVLERRKTNMIVYGSGASKKEGTKEDDKEKDKKPDTISARGNDDFLGFGDGSFGEGQASSTAAERVSATTIGDTSVIVTQGKMIEASLETGINTDLPGIIIRAVVTRDVYGESGRFVLIPKGSKLIGEYDASVKDGQTRVDMQWTRLIMPGGVDIQLNSPGSDHLGRGGVTGTVDNKFWTRMGTAFMISYVIPLATTKLSGKGSEQVTTTTTTNPAGGSTTATGGSVEALQLRDASQKFQQIAEDSVKSTFSAKPTIVVDQGTPLTILVKKDLVFKRSIIGRLSPRNKIMVTQ